MKNMKKCLLSLFLFPPLSFPPQFPTLNMQEPPSSGNFKNIKKGKIHIFTIILHPHKPSIPLQYFLNPRREQFSKSEVRTVKVRQSTQGD